MTVVERTLAGALPQVFALDADRPILDNLGIDPDRTLSVLPGDILGTLPEVCFPGAPDPDRELASYQRAVGEVESLAERLLAAVLHRAGLSEGSSFSGTGFGTGGASPEELVARLGVVPEHVALFRAQLDILVAAGWLTVAAGGGVLPAGRTVEAEAELVGALDELTVRHPALTPVATLLRDCLTALPDVLTGRRPAMEILFPGGSAERVAAVYRGDPVTDRCNAEVARLVVEQVRVRRPPTRQLRCGSWKSAPGRAVRRRPCSPRSPRTATRSSTSSPTCPRPSSARRAAGSARIIPSPASSCWTSRPTRPGRAWCSAYTTWSSAPTSCTPPVGCPTR